MGVMVMGWLAWGKLLSLMEHEGVWIGRRAANLVSRGLLPVWRPAASDPGHHHLMILSWASPFRRPSLPSDQEKEEEVQRVRLKNIHLNNQMKRIEQTLKQKEELAEGLHLIDFEQLKIENQSLNEKIEERNEELLKLRKKTTTTVQV